MLVKIEVRILIFPGTDFHFPSTSVPAGTFLGSGLCSMDGAEWFSTLDLRSGYHNIPIRECDRDKTAFITRRGCFRYKVLPFGCTTAPSNFQRLTDLVLCGLTYTTCLVYLDDVIVYGRSFDEHLMRLREVLPGCVVLI